MPPPASVGRPREAHPHHEVVRLTAELGATLQQRASLYKATRRTGIFFDGDKVLRRFVLMARQLNWHTILLGGEGPRLKANDSDVVHLRAISSWSRQSEQEGVGHTRQNVGKYIR